MCGGLDHQSFGCVAKWVGMVRAVGLAGQEVGAGVWRVMGILLWALPELTSRSQCRQHRLRRAPRRATEACREWSPTPTDCKNCGHCCCTNAALLVHREGSQGFFSHHTACLSANRRSKGVSRSFHQPRNRPIFSVLCNGAPTCNARCLCSQGRNSSVGGPHR